MNRNRWITERMKFFHSNPPTPIAEIKAASLSVERTFPFLRNRSDLSSIQNRRKVLYKQAWWITLPGTTPFFFPFWNRKAFIIICIFLLSDFLKGNIYRIIIIAVINAQRSNKAVQCPNCVQTLFRIIFIRITQDIYRTGQMPFHLLQCR